MNTGNSLPSRFLLAFAQRDGDEVRRLRGLIDQTWHRFGSAVTRASLEVALREWFQHATDADIARLGDLTRQAFPKHTHLLDRDDLRKVIRDGLGETEAAHGIEGPAVQTIQQLVFTAIVWAKQLTAPQITEWLARAEDLAQDWGFAPPVRR